MGGFGGVVRDLADRGAVAIGNAMERQPVRTAITNTLDKGIHFRGNTYLPGFTESIANGLRKSIFNMDSEFVKTEAAKDIKIGLETIQQNAAKLNSQYAEAALAKKPIMIPQAGGGTKPLVDPGEMHAHAMKTARALKWGSRDQHLQTLLHVASKQGGDNHAQMLSSHLMVELHDTAPPGTGMNTMANNFRLNNKVKKAEPSFEAKDTNPFKAPGPVEKVLKKVSNTIFAGKAAAPHSTNFMLSTLDNSIKSSMKGFLATLPVNGNYENSKLFIQAMGLIPEHAITEYKQQFAYQASWLKGIVDKQHFIPGSIGEMIHRNFSIPGLSAVRRITLVNSAMVGKYEMDELGVRLMRTANPELIEAKLKRLGLNPDKIRSQNGFMKNDDYEMGIFKSVNKDIGMTGSLQRTQLSQSTVMGRMMFQFHSAVTRMTKTVYDGYMFDFKNKDFVGLARRTAILSLAYPEFGNGINLVEDMWAGKGVETSWEEYKKREDKMWGSHGVPNMISERLFAMAHMGITGTSINYMRSLGKNQIAKQLGGPIASSAVELVQDANTARKTDSDHPNRSDQFERDLIHMSMPAWMSGLVAHAAVPTKADRDKNKPRSSRSLRSSARRKALKKANPSSNPLNRLTDELNEDN